MYVEMATARHSGGPPFRGSAIPEVRHSGGPPREDEMGNRRLGSLDYLKCWVQPTALVRNRRFSIYFRL